MNLSIAKPPREANGHFSSFSQLGDKYFGVKLFKEDQEALVELAKEQGVSPTELTRLIVHQWFKSHDT